MEMPLHDVKPTVLALCCRIATNIADPICRAVAERDTVIEAKASMISIGLSTDRCTYCTLVKKVGDSYFNRNDWI